MTNKEVIQGLEGIESRAIDFPYMTAFDWVVIAAAKRKLNHNTAWKPADGDNLPEIDREVIALVVIQDYYKVVFAHRPNPNRGAICYDKGEWNQPNVIWWLDLELPKMEE